MADKINKEESISRVYQFLNKYNGDWKADADINNDNTIIKTEFRTFLNSNFQWNGETDKQKEDIITTFWKSIDTQTTGKLTNGKGISDKNALNADELVNVENNIKATDLVVKYVKNISMPEGIDSKYQTKWKESVKAGMINRAIEFLKNGTLEELTEEKLNEFYGLSSIKATADYKAYTEIDSQLGEYKDLGYTAGDDTVLQGVINDYISQLEDEGKSQSEVLNDVKKIVSAYVDTAKTNSQASIDTLAEYGYDPDGLNPLQIAVLTAELNNRIGNQVKSKNSEIYDTYKTELNSKIESYVNSIIKSGDDFNTIKSKMSDYVSDFMKTEYAAIEKDYNEKQEQIRTARAELNTYIGKILAENNEKKTAVIQNIIGTTNAAEISNKLLSLKTIEAINSVKKQIEDEINAIEAAKHNVTDKSAELKNIINVDGNAVMTFYVNDKGDIKFVNYNVVSGAFNDEENAYLNSKFAQIKEKLEAGYKDELEMLGLTDSQKTNLYNAALFTALSDESILPSQYEENDLGYVVEKLIEIYTKLLQKVAADTTGKTLEYIKGYQRNSILAGRTPAASNYTEREGYRNSDASVGMDRYYYDDDTDGDDDKIGLGSTKVDTITYSGITGSIIHLSTGATYDDSAFNKAVDMMIKDYVNKNKDIIDKNRIMELFYEAEKTAIDKVKAITNTTKPAGTSVYGYAENVSGAGNDNFDTYHGGGLYNIGSVLLEIMYEMEALIAREILG